MLETQLRRRPLRTAVLVVSVVGAAVTGIGYHAPPGVVAGIGIPVVIFSAFALPVATGMTRPKSMLMLVAFLVGMGIIGVSVNSAPSAWLLTFGKTEVCQINALDKHTNTRSPSSYHHRVACGDQQLTYTKTYGFAGEVGGQVELVTDRTGVLKPLRPTDLSTLKALLLPGALLLGLGFVHLVVTKPRRKKKTAEEIGQPAK